jgi:hypothetical protein
LLKTFSFLALAEEAAGERKAEVASPKKTQKA